MIAINLLQISEDRTTIDISITTNSDDSFTKIELWNENTFKDYSLAIDLSSKLVGTTNNEVFTITKEEANVDSFTGIYFLEITSTDNTPEVNCNNCINPTLAVVADLSIFREILLQRVLELSNCTSDIFNGEVCSNSNANNILNIHMLMESTFAALQIGYYSEALNLINSLKRLVNETFCNDCNDLENITFKSGLNYGILNKNIILN